MSENTANKNIKNIGVAICDVCKMKRADCVEVRKNWFTSVTICDSCGREVFRSYDGRTGGPA